MTATLVVPFVGGPLDGEYRPVGFDWDTRQPTARVIMAEEAPELVWILDNPTDDTYLEPPRQWTYTARQFACGDGLLWGYFAHPDGPSTVVPVVVSEASWSSRADGREVEVLPGRLVLTRPRDVFAVARRMRAEMDDRAWHWMGIREWVTNERRKLDGESAET